MQDPVLQPRQDPVANILVEWHSPLQRAEACRHARAEYRTRFVPTQRGQQIGKAFRGVLSVPMNQRNDVEPVLNGIVKSNLLVAAITLLDGVVQHRLRKKTITVFLKIVCLAEGLVLR